MYSFAAFKFDKNKNLIYNICIESEVVSMYTLIIADDSDLNWWAEEYQKVNDNLIREDDTDSINLYSGKYSAVCISKTCPKNLNLRCFNEIIVDKKLTSTEEAKLMFGIGLSNPTIIWITDDEPQLNLSKMTTNDIIKYLNIFGKKDDYNNVFIKELLMRQGVKV